jgi:hypothetical protein
MDIKVRLKHVFSPPSPQDVPHVQLLSMSKRRDPKIVDITLPLALPLGVEGATQVLPSVSL